MTRSDTVAPNRGAGASFTTLPACSSAACMHKPTRSPSHATSPLSPIMQRIGSAGRTSPSPVPPRDVLRLPPTREVDITHAFRLSPPGGGRGSTMLPASGCAGAISAVQQSPTSPSRRREYPAEAESVIRVGARDSPVTRVPSKDTLAPDSGPRYELPDAMMAHESLYSSIAKVNHCSSSAETLQMRLGLSEHGIRQVLTRSRPTSVRAMRTSHSSGRAPDAACRD